MFDGLLTQTLIGYLWMVDLMMLIYFFLYVSGLAIYNVLHINYL